jgi:hypothetical protein
MFQRDNRVGLKADLHLSVILSAAKDLAGRRMRRDQILRCAQDDKRQITIRAHTRLRQIAINSSVCAAR